MLLDEISEELELPQLAEEMARILGERDTCDVVNKLVLESLLCGNDKYEQLKLFIPLSYYSLIMKNRKKE